MLNMLVVEDNFYYSMCLINIVVEKIPQIRLCKIATNGEEALEYLKNSNNIDIVLLDLGLPKLNGLEIIKQLEENNYKKYENSIIVISGDAQLVKYVIGNPFLYTYISKGMGLDKVLSEIDKLSKIKQNEIRQNNILQLINNELRTLGYKENLIGTKYLRETINLIATTDLTSDNLKNKVYPIIARRHNKSVHNIKCNINNATEMMNCTCKKEIIRKYFVFFDDNSVATPKQVIDTILTKIGNHNHP